jgi:hypothetical protein
VLESLAGSREESLKADPFIPTNPPSAASIAIQANSTKFLRRMHNRASSAMTRTPFESPMNRRYQLSRKRDCHASTQRSHFGVPRTPYVKPVPGNSTP